MSPELTSLVNEIQSNYGAVKKEDVPPAERPEIASAEFEPREPKSLEDGGLSELQVEALTLKALFQCGTASGRDLAGTIHLPFGL